MEVGNRQVSAIDGRDIRRWFAAWSQPDRDGGKRKIAAAPRKCTTATDWKRHDEVAHRRTPSHEQ